MSRKIKFRVWECTRKNMRYDGIVLDMQDCSRHAPHAISDCDATIILMQYTGLEDKSGKIIYESDIINVFDWGGAGELLGVTSVVWDVDECGWRYENTSLTEDFYDQFRNVEVIGNIYEHIPLLENNHE